MDYLHQYIKYTLIIVDAHRSFLNINSDILSLVPWVGFIKHNIWAHLQSWLRRGWQLQELLTWYGWVATRVTRVFVSPRSSHQDRQTHSDGHCPSPPWFRTYVRGAGHRTEKERHQGHVALSHDRTHSIIPTREMWRKRGGKEPGTYITVKKKNAYLQATKGSIDMPKYMNFNQPKQWNPEKQEKINI